MLAFYLNLKKRICKLSDIDAYRRANTFSPIKKNSG